MADEREVQAQLNVDIPNEECARNIEAVLSGIPGVTAVRCDVAQAEVWVQGTAPVGELVASLRQLGRTVTVHGVGAAHMKRALESDGAGCAVALLLPPCTALPVLPSPSPIQASYTRDLRPSDVDFGSADVKSVGAVRFVRMAADRISVEVMLEGVAPGLHGLHIYESGDVSCVPASLGHHWNPLGAPHGSPHDGGAHHLGDLGNVAVDVAGKALAQFEVSGFEILDIIGLAVGLSAQPDDLGKGEDAASQTTGNSGAVVALGVVARSASPGTNLKKVCTCDAQPQPRPPAASPAQ